MSEIDFQNGLICGMATRGLVRSGQLYEPIIWSDFEVYSHFYIDFKGTLALTSLGMVSSSLIVTDSNMRAITGLLYISPGVYRVSCNISNVPSGLTIANKATSLLTFSSGRRVPTFSVHFYPEGAPRYAMMAYAYDVVLASQRPQLFTVLDTGTDASTFWAIDERTPISESIINPIMDNIALLGVVDSVVISYWSV